MLCVPAAGQAETLKEKAIAQFKVQDYSAAIECLQGALAEAPNHVDIYYYLGCSTHYLCYNSMPLSGFSRDKSDEVLGYLRKAAERVLTAMREFVPEDLLPVTDNLKRNIKALKRMLNRPAMNGH